MEKEYFNSVFKIEMQMPVLHMQHVCWDTSIMDGVTLCTMGTERLNAHTYVWTYSVLLYVLTKSKGKLYQYNEKTASVCD